MVPYTLALLLKREKSVKSRSDGFFCNKKTSHFSCGLYLPRPLPLFSSTSRQEIFPMKANKLFRTRLQCSFTTSKLELSVGSAADRCNGDDTITVLMVLALVVVLLSAYDRLGMTIGSTPRSLLGGGVGNATLT